MIYSKLSLKPQTCLPQIKRHVRLQNKTIICPHSTCRLNINLIFRNFLELNSTSFDFPLLSVVSVKQNHIWHTYTKCRVNWVDTKQGLSYGLHLKVTCMYQEMCTTAQIDVSFSKCHLNHIIYIINYAII